MKLHAPGTERGKESFLIFLRHLKKEMSNKEKPLWADELEGTVISSQIPSGIDGATSRKCHSLPPQTNKQTNTQAILYKIGQDYYFTHSEV